MLTFAASKSAFGVSGRSIYWGQGFESEGAFFTDAAYRTREDNLHYWCHVRHPSPITYVITYIKRQL
jgi:hypothetical protein